MTPINSHTVEATAKAAFAGVSLVSKDGTRLNAPTLYKDDTQEDRVRFVLAENRFCPMTLAQIAALGEISNPASVASRIRDLRTQGYVIERSQQPSVEGGQRTFAYTFTGYAG
jgi:hypothetical protein